MRREGIAIFDHTFHAEAAVTGRRFVKAAANKPYTVAPAGAGEEALGVALEDFNPAIDGTYGGVGVRLAGIAKVISGAAVNASQAVEADAQGRAVPLTTGKQAGVALTGAPGAGYEIDVLLK